MHVLDLDYMSESDEVKGRGKNKQTFIIHNAHTNVPWLNIKNHTLYIKIHAALQTHLRLMHS